MYKGLIILKFKPAYPKTVILYVLLINLVFLSPILLLLLSDRYKEMWNVFYEMLPLYSTFSLFLLMSLAIHRKGIQTDSLLNKFNGPTEIVRTYFKLFVKGKRITLLWLLFWLSVIVFGIKAIKAVMF